MAGEKITIDQDIRQVSAGVDTTDSEKVIMLRMDAVTKRLLTESAIKEYSGDIASKGLPIRGAFQVNDVEEPGGSITYVGKESEDGTWWLVKINESSSPTTIQHASITTDSTRTTYSLAWTNRVSLTYGDYSVAF